jgi:hypothetical protein
MAMNVAIDVLDDVDFLVDLTVERKSAGSYVDGIYQPSLTTLINFKGSVQPATAEDFVNRPEGERVEGDLVVFTTQQLIGSKNLVKADIVQGFQGADWKITLVENWSQHGYYKAHMTRLGD